MTDRSKAPERTMSGPMLAVLHKSIESALLPNTVREFNCVVCTRVLYNLRIDR
jgi:hypothetical protein